MKKIVIEGIAGASTIYVGESFSNIDNYLPTKNVFMIVDHNVYDLYFDDRDTDIFIIHGECDKRPEVAVDIYRWLLAKGADRGAFILGVGGGVTCDIAGFVASTFMRGVRFGFVATTLLSQADASVGGKNGINIDGYKNMVGTFNQPDFVICDTEMLKSLPQEEILNGLAEVVKHTLIADYDMFCYIESNIDKIKALDSNILYELVAHSVKVKSEIVIKDPKESSVRRNLNFGHTWGHAVERVTGLSHGKSVSIGMAYAANLSVERGLLSKAEYDRVLSLLKRLGLPTDINDIPGDHSMETIHNVMLLDKKRSDGNIFFIMPVQLGSTHPFSFKIIKKSRVDGAVEAPASKSGAQRAIAIVALAQGRSTIYRTGKCDDVLAAIDVCRGLGARFLQDGDSLVVDGLLEAPSEPLNCGESGLGIRMFAGIAAIFDRPVVLTGHGSLLSRPMNLIEKSYREMGVQVTTNNGFLPIHVKGPLPGGDIYFDGSQGSQVLTGLLIASPFAGKETTVYVENLQSRQYIDMTLDMMKEYGVEALNHNYERFTIASGQRYMPADVVVEGDWSGAAFMLVAGAIAGRVKVRGLLVSSKQPDRAILEVLAMVGANISIKDSEVEVSRGNECGNLSPFHFDARNSPDLFPPLVALAAYCDGESRILGVSRLRTKESDRAKTLQLEFAKMGIEIKISGDLMMIQGGAIRGAVVNSHNDHRIAMACAVAALGGCGDVVIGGAECVAKSYPNFFSSLSDITEPS